MAHFREVCQIERGSNTLYLVSVAFLRAVGKGSSIHLTAFNPVEKERSDPPALWQMSLKYPTVLLPKDEV